MPLATTLVNPYSPDEGAVAELRKRLYKTPTVGQGLTLRGAPKATPAPQIESSSAVTPQVQESGANLANPKLEARPGFTQSFTAQLQQQGLRSKFLGATPYKPQTSYTPGQTVQQGLSNLQGFQPASTSTYSARLKSGIKIGQTATKQMIDYQERLQHERELALARKLAAQRAKAAAAGKRSGIHAAITAGGYAITGSAYKELKTIGAKAVRLAMKSIGVPYVYGGTNLSRGVDCSGLTYSVYKALGISIPRVSKDQARAGRIVSGGLRNAMPGDLIIMDSPVLGRNRHVALYAGGGKMIEAPHTGAYVRLVPVSRNVNVVVRPY